MWRRSRSGSRRSGLRALAVAFLGMVSGCSNSPSRIEADTIAGSEKEQPGCSPMGEMLPSPAAWTLRGTLVVEDAEGQLERPATRVAPSCFGASGGPRLVACALPMGPWRSNTACSNCRWPLGSRHCGCNVLPLATRWLLVPRSQSQCQKTRAHRVAREVAAGSALARCGSRNRGGSGRRDGARNDRAYSGCDPDAVFCRRRKETAKCSLRTVPPSSVCTAVSVSGRHVLDECPMGARGRGFGVRPRNSTKMW